LYSIVVQSGWIQNLETWKEWLREVEAIITKAEKTVFEDLRTEEDRARFVSSFWKVRDPDPGTRQNEYKLEYYKRLDYVKKFLGGSRTDQGRIYMILGAPTDRSSFTGGESVVDSEVWTYYGENRPGLPPVMNLLFYRRDNAGPFRLFYPGMDSAVDILSPGYRTDRLNHRQAYNELRQSYIELADATLSVIPGEGHPLRPASSSLSSRVFAQIYTLPAREASDTYLRGFQSLEGIVDVTYSFKEMPGTVATALSENRGYLFLNYSVMPDTIHLQKIADNINSAKFSLNVKTEDMDGRTIYQQEKNIEFKLSDIEKDALAKKKISFSGFLPVIEGSFRMNIMFTNKTTEEFLVHEEMLEITEKTVPVIIGFKAADNQSDRYLPFSTEMHKISFDPRFAFNKTDHLVGIVFQEIRPDVRLVRVDNEEIAIEVQDVVKYGKYYVFRQPLADVSSSNYHLTVSTQGEEIFRKMVAILSFLAKKPDGYEWNDPPTSGPAYNFELATQYLNSGNFKTAIEYFETLPEPLWNSFTIPVIAKAYYRNKDYAKVLELLERDAVKKDYSSLFLLGNSALELQKLDKAAEYFEQLRNYGDTAKINQVLGAIYLSLGEREKAKVYFERANDLEAQPEDKKQDR
jgi:GWxTD domain-containing protein